MSIPNNLKFVLINCGYITLHIAKKYLNIPETSMNQYTKNKELNVNKLVLFGKVVDIYTLTQKDIVSLRREGHCIYKHDSNQLEHDYLLLKTFVLLSQKERSTWLNETSLKQKFGKHTETSDAIFIRNRKIIGLEIITPEYKKDKKDKKLEFLKSKCDDYILLNTKDYWRCSDND